MLSLLWCFNLASMHYINPHDTFGEMCCTVAQTENKEILDVTLNTPAEDKIYRIPPDIRPKMTSYRLEVIFWGVRDMKKIKCMPVRRPRIIVECAGIHVKSEVMKNAKRFSNFEEPYIMIELVIRRNYLENISSANFITSASCLYLCAI